MKSIFFFLIFFLSFSVQAQFQYVSTGSSNSCVADSTNVYCWGINVNDSGVGAQGFKNIRQLASGEYFNCVVDDEGVWCWGKTDNITQASGPNVGVTSLSIFHQTVCYLEADKTLRCFGTLASRPLFPSGTKADSVDVGNGTICITQKGLVTCREFTAPDYMPRRAPPADLGEVLDMKSSYGMTSCAITKARKIRCWGLYDYKVDYLENVKQIGFGRDCMFVLTDTSFACYNYKGEVVAKAVPVDLEMPASFSASINHACLITNTGKQRCWGSDEYGEVSQFPPTIKNITHMQLFNEIGCYDNAEGRTCTGVSKWRNEMGADLTGITQMAENYFGRCFVHSLGLKCFYEPQFQVVQPELTDVKEVLVSAQYACAIASNEIKCWGGKFGYVPLGSSGALKNPRMLVGGFDHVCALTDEGVKCWGQNESGQLNVPDDVRNVKKLVSGRSYTCALTMENEVFCWGRNDAGQTEVPVTLGRTTELVSGHNHVCALDEEGVKCWGSNSDSQLLVPTTTKKILELASGAAFSCFRDEDNVKCWGSNLRGQYNFYQ